MTDQILEALRVASGAFADACGEFIANVAVCADGTIIATNDHGVALVYRIEPQVYAGQVAVNI